MDQSTSEVTNFDNYHLRRIVKENHGAAINKIIMGGSVNGGTQDLSNMLLTVGEKQMNIYDNQNGGDHLDLVHHFILPAEDPENVGSFNVGCWIQTEDDAIIGFGGDSGIIHLVSLGFSQEIGRLYGHQGSIKTLLPHPKCKNWLIGISDDESIFLWDIHTQKSLLDWEFSAKSACINQNGDILYLGDDKGSIYELYLPSSKRQIDYMKENELKPEFLIKLSENRISGITDLICFDDTLIAKTEGGKVFKYQLSSLNLELQITLKFGRSNDSKIDISESKKFLCIGNPNGSISVYSLSTGKSVFEFSHRRSTKPVISCIFAKNDRNIIFTSGEGLIWRVDYIPDEVLAQWEEWRNQEFK